MQRDVRFSTDLGLVRLNIGTEVAKPYLVTIVLSHSKVMSTHELTVDCNISPD